MQYFYHLKPHNFKGSSLLPLNLMEEKFPKLYKKELSKYDGRETDIKRKIKCFDNKTWKDVINFSTINPVIVLTFA
jgi:hypothetical protein